MIEDREFALSWHEGAHSLGMKDPVLGGLITRYPDERLEPHGDVFHSLVRAIVGQQISVIAAERIWQRLIAATSGVTPETIACCGQQALLTCGLTRNKVQSISHAARTFASDDWTAIDHDETRQRLLGLKGVGPWTADMVMIFALGHLDILPAADIGLQRAVAGLYGLPRCPARIHESAELWRPWRTIANWYLWRQLDPIPVAY